jgi:hypothetical protein
MGRLLRFWRALNRPILESPDPSTCPHPEWAIETYNDGMVGYVECHRCGKLL